MIEYADAEVAAINKKKDKQAAELAKGRKAEIESVREAVAKEKPAKPRKVPTAKDLEGLAPREPDPEPMPVALDVSPGESEAIRAIATAAHLLEEKAIRCLWQVKNDKTLGSRDRQVYRYKATAFSEAAQMVREVDLGGT